MNNTLCYNGKVEYIEYQMDNISRDENYKNPKKKLERKIMVTEIKKVFDRLGRHTIAKEKLVNL